MALLCVLILPTSVYAAPEYINFQANIRKPDGTRLEAPDVSFRLKYLNATATCTVYVEDYLNQSMVGSGGNVSLRMGNGTKAFPVTATTLYSTFNNAVSNVMPCAEGGTYSPTLATERRLITVEFFYNGSAGLQTISNIEINSVPYAMHATNAEQLNGFAANLYTKFSDFTTCTGGNVLTYNGTAFSCVAAGGSSQWTTNGSDIHFNTGNVGIGTSTPSALLTVANPANALNTSQSLLVLNNNTTGLGAAAIEFQTNGNSRARIEGWGPGANKGEFRFYTYDTTGVDSEKVRFAADGNVGIGITNPAYKLDVAGDVNVTGNFKVNGVNITAGGGTVTSVTASPPLLSSGGNTPDISMPAATAVVDGYLSATDFTTFNNKVSSQWTNNLTDIYFNTGKVGLGTTTPASKLSLADSQTYSTASLDPGSADYSFLIENTANVDTSYAGMKFLGHKSGGFPYYSSIVTTAASGNGYRSNLEFVNAADALGEGSFIFKSKNPTDSNVYTHMLINGNTGNIGVGTTTPAYKIDVAGDINVTGNFKINGTNISNTPSPWLMNVADTYFNTGKVGIGTNTPATDLDVAGRGQFQTTVANVLNVVGKGSGYADSTNGIATFHSENTVGSGGNVIKADSVYAPNTFVVKDNGNVGIGTASPSARIDVYDSGLRQFASPSDGVEGGFYSNNTQVNFTNRTNYGAGNYLSVFTGNSAVSAPPMILGNGNMPIIFGTSGLNERMRIDAVGNVGVGITAPAYKIDVAGDINVTGNFKINGTNISNTPSPWLMNTGDTYFNTGNVGIGTSTPESGFALDVRGLAAFGTSGSARIYTGTTDATHAFIQSRDLSVDQKLTFSASAYNFSVGNVGIGTSTPLEKFQVVDGNISMKTGGGAFTTPVLKWQGSDNSERFAVSGQTETVGASTDEWKFANLFGFTSFVNSTVETMRLTSDNKVGIGTTTPGYKLDVAGDVNVTGNFKINGTNINTTPSPWLLNGVDTYFNTGNVGVGTATPGANLEVKSSTANGSVRISSDAASNVAGVQTLSFGTNVGGVYNQTAVMGDTSGGDENFKLFAVRADLVLGSLAGGNVKAGSLTATSLGNIGIGTTTPTVKTHIYDAVAGSFTGLAIDNRKTYGVGTGTSETSRMILSLTEIGIPDPLNRVMGYVEAGTESETSSASGFIALGTRSGGVESEKVRINSAGNMGLGTTAPVYKLDVAGDVNVTGNFKINGTNISNTPSPWLMNAADTYFNTGDVGIGTNTPSAGTIGQGGTSFANRILNVSSTGRTTAAIRSDNTNNIATLMLSANNAAPYDLHINHDSTGNTDFHQYRNGASGSVLYFQNDGFIGIGTKTPASKLSNVGTADAWRNVGDSAATGVSPGTAFVWNSVSGGYAQTLSNTSGAINGNGLQVRVAGTAATQRILTLGTGVTGGAVNADDVMVVQGNGNVGIGHTSPSTKLQVGTTGADEVRLGKISFNTNIANIIDESFGVRVKLADDAGANRFHVENASGAPILTAKSDQKIGVNNSSPMYAFDVTGDVNVTGNFKINGTNISNTPSPWLMNVADTYFNTGNVGIGTNTPTSALHVEKNMADYAGYIHQTGGATSAYGGLKIRTESTGVNSLLVNNAGTDLFVVKGTGNVGIGTATPIAGLDISGGTNPILHVAGTVNPVFSSQGGYFGWNALGGGGQGETDFINNPGSGGGVFAFMLGNAAGTTKTTAMFINGVGNVGIGTINPSYALDVTGDVNVTGNFKVNGVNFAGGVTGSGTVNKISRFTASGTIGDSNISDNGTVVTVSTDAKINTVTVGRGPGNDTTNTAVGYFAMNSNTTGRSNTATGSSSLTNNTDGNSNTSHGDSALRYNTLGSSNTAFGADALRVNSTGDENTAVGSAALSSNQTGSRNAAVGPYSLYSTTGSGNLALGYYSGYNITTGSNNVILGSNNGSGIATSSNNVIISDGSGNIRMQVDNTGRVGVDTVAPRAKFEVNGSVVQKQAIANPTATVDFGLGNLHYTTLDCQAFTLHNLKDGGSYMFVVQGTNPATCSFTAYSDAGVTPLIVKLPPDHGATTNGKETIYNLVVMGSKVYFSWTPGY